MSTELLNFASLMKDESLPSLEDACMLSVNKFLLTQNNVTKYFHQHFNAKQISSSFSSTKVCNIKSVCKSLHIPELIEAKVLCILRWMVKRHFHYIHFMITELPLVNKFPQKKDFTKLVMDSVIWNSNATVNYPMSAHKLISSLQKFEDDKSLALMFKIAAMYCLEEDVKLIWSKLSASVKNDIFQDEGDKSNDFFYSYFMLKDSSPNCCFVLYWACLMRGNMTKFVNSVVKHLQKIEGSVMNGLPKTAKSFALALSVFEGNSCCVDFYLKSSGLDTNHLKFINRIYIKNVMGRSERHYENAVILRFLLCKIKDDAFVNEMFKNHSDTFLKLSAKYWLWHKYLVSFVKMTPNIDQDLFYKILSELLGGVYFNPEKCGMFLIKNLWKNTKIELKKSFCSMILSKEKDYKPLFRCFWRYLSLEVVDMFLRDEETREILNPYDNNGLIELIYTPKFDVINHWLEKCLVTEEAIVTFMENFLKTKSIKVIKQLLRSTLAKVNEFLKWVYRYEEKMNKEEVLKMKDETIEEVCVLCFYRGVQLKKWKDLEKFTDWVLENRNDYDDKLISLKKETLSKLFHSPGIKSWGENDFREKFKGFLNYGINDVDKLKKMMNEVYLNEGETCSRMLENGDYLTVVSYLYFFKGYERDIWEIMKDILYYIFYYKYKECNFKKSSYWTNIQRLLNWEFEIDSVMKEKVWEIKKSVMDRNGPMIILNCLRNNSSDVLDNILKFFFGSKDENTSKAVYDLKIRTIDQLMKGYSFWEKKYEFKEIINFINWGICDENIKKEIWNTKKYFIENFKNSIKAKVIPDFIFANRNFIYSLFDDCKDESDFGTVLWDLKESLLKEIANNEDHMLTCQLFEKYKDFIGFFVWNFVNDNGMKGLRELYLDKKGIVCCLYWILNNKFPEMTCFLQFCFTNDPQMNIKILRLKQNLLENVLCKYSKNWGKEYFERLDKFLLINANGLYLKKDLIEKFSAKSCVEGLGEGNWSNVKDFLDWAFVGLKENKQSTENLKRNILIKVLDVNSSNYWCNYSFCKAVDEFLYKYHNFDSAIISNMKLDLIELHFFTILEKLLAERKRVNINHLWNWILDEYIKSNEFRPRIAKLYTGIFEQFGKEYCVLMLIFSDSYTATRLLDRYFEVQTDPENKKSLLWDFKKDCIKETLAIVADENNSDQVDMETFWGGLDNFMSWDRNPSSSEVCELKDVVRQQFGISVIKKFFKALLRKQLLFQPLQALRWFFGFQARIKTDVDEKILLDFKKELLENLISEKFEFHLTKDAFYKVMEEMLNFNSTDPASISILKKSVMEVQGVALCIHLICRSYYMSPLERFLEWGITFVENGFLDFKMSVLTELVENLTLTYYWSSLKSFLEYGFNLDQVQDREKYSILKNYVSESCGVDICYNWILKNQWREIADFLEWGFEPPGIKNLKNGLIDKYGPDYCNARISDNDWEKLKKFLCWSFESHEDDNEKEERIINLKIKTLKDWICYEDHLEIIISFLEYGFITKAGLDKFKESILKKDHPLNYFVAEQKYKSEEAFKLFFSCKD